MKEFSCSSVVEGCDASFQAETDEGILEQAAAHAKDAHGMDEIPPAVEQQVRESIREVPA